DLRGEPARQVQGHRHHARGAQLRSVPAVRRSRLSRRRQATRDPPLTSVRPRMTDDIDRLLAELQRMASPPVLDRVRALVAALLDVHATGLGRVMSLLDARGEAGQAIRRELLRDREVEKLLLLHGLHPIALAGRVEAALADIAPALRAQGAATVVLAAEAGRVAVRIDAVATAAPRGNVRSLVEQALVDAAPDAEVEIALGFADAFVPVA